MIQRKINEKFIYKCINNKYLLKTIRYLDSENDHCDNCFFLDKFCYHDDIVNLTGSCENPL